MPLPSSQTGAGKKGGPGSMRAQPRSRNTTPSAAMPPTASLPPVETVDTETLDLRFEMFRNLNYDDLVDTGSSNSLIPDSKSLDGILSRLQRLGEIIEKRGSFCDRGMRLMAQSRRQRMDEMVVDRGMDDGTKKEGDDESQKARKAKPKKRKALDHLAPRGKTDQSSSPHGKGRKLSRDNDSASSSLSPVTPHLDLEENKEKTEGKDDDSDSDSSDDGRPPPPVRPQANTFGDDPSTFPDPTVYEIRDVLPGMSEEEIKEIYSVAGYPKSDLSDQIAGFPPDKDFSNAKPSNQINFSTFSSYIDPYFRLYSEEDLAFLRERGDRVVPFNVPRRGSKHYTEVWAEEDTGMVIDSTPGRDRLPPNQARGSIENMDDDVAETDKLSVGPLLARLMQAMRPEHRAPPPEDRPMANGVNGDGDSMNGIGSFDFGFDLGPGPSSQSQVNGIPNGNGTGLNGAGSTNPGEQALPAATYMPESNSEAWKKATHPKLDYQQVDERLKQELRHIGFLPMTTGGHDGSSGAGSSTPQPDPAAQADYDGHFDDEVAARMRLLQARLREQVLINGARKARLTDLVKERMAHQEYQTILEDLDNQVQAAYQKRTRTMGKKPKKSRPGANAASAAGGAAGAGAGGAAGMARPGIGDMTKTLMERRKRWIESIGTVFDDENLGRVPRAEDPDSSIFKPAVMADLLKKEREAWDEEVEEE